jgi:alkylation response protein AidB-like acyl-CoA dehydrogenase
MNAAPSPTLTQCASAEELERQLGDPCHPESAFSFQRAVELDENDAFPETACAMLDGQRFHDIYIPAALGGAWRDTDEITMLMRLVARRDLTVAIGYGKTFLGSLPVWMDGSTEQQEALRDIIRDRGQVSLALTERAHGGDLAATDVTATLEGDRLRLAGEKWLINNATRGRALSVLASMGETEPPHPLSMIFVDKRQVLAGACRHLPKNLTHGIKGADISGIAFDDCVLPASSIIGRPGRGFSTVLRLLQLTRVGCCPLSLGAGDTALRATLDFALSRQLYGQTMFELPYARSLITSSFVGLLIAEAVTLTAARTLHVLPTQLGVASAISKYIVPTTVEGLIRDLSVALGARYYLRSGHWSGIFEKIVRDNAIVGLFDGSTVVNLDALAAQLPALADGRRATPIDLESSRALGELSAPLPAFDLSRISLLSGGRNDVVALLPKLARELEDLDAAEGEAEVLATIRALLGTIIGELQRDEAAIRTLGDERSERFKSPRVFALAQRYGLVYAAAACAQLWFWNRGASEALVGRPEWLALALAHLADRLRPHHGEQPPPRAVAAVEAEMVRMHLASRLFSLLPVQLATEPA